jgi:hypothetical protein
LQQKEFGNQVDHVKVGMFRVDNEGDSPKMTPTQIPRDLLTPKINKNLTEHGQMPTKLSLLVNNRKECHENFEKKHGKMFLK